MDKLSYALGIAIGQQVLQMGLKNIVYKDFEEALHKMIEGKEVDMLLRDAQQTLQAFYANEQLKHKEAGEKYLAENAKKDGVITLPSGLQYQVLKEGNGKKPSAKDTVMCHYEGFLIDGTLFDSSVQRGEPATFSLQQVITGWTEGLQLMQEGAKYRFFIPYRLAYGEGGTGGVIPPYAALVFDVELIQVI
jgi:FKBP-type peptidyl-prolyl cis-trans isomerase FklB